VIPKHFLGLILSGCLLPFSLLATAVPSVTPTWIQLTQEARDLSYLAQGDRAKWEEGQQKAEAARKLAPNEPAPAFWWAANVARILRAEKNLSSLRKLKQVELVLLDVRSSQPDFGYAAADRMLAVIYYEAPRFISIGSTSDAEEHFLAALKRAPQFPGNHLAWIEFLVAEERWELARKALGKLKERGLEGNFGDFAPEAAEWPARTLALEQALNRSRS